MTSRNLANITEVENCRVLADMKGGASITGQASDRLPIAVQLADTNVGKKIAHLFEKLFDMIRVCFKNINLKSCHKGKIVRTMEVVLLINRQACKKGR